MATVTVEERLSALEETVAQLLIEKGTKPNQELPWWERIVGTFKDDPEYDDAMRLGREYRESLRPKQPSDTEEAPV